MRVRRLHGHTRKKTVVSTIFVGLACLVIVIIWFAFATSWLISIAGSGHRNRVPIYVTRYEQLLLPAAPRKLAPAVEYKETPHVYFINLDKSKERRRAMEAMFERIKQLDGQAMGYTRVAAVDLVQTKQMLRDHKFELNEATVEDGLRNITFNRYEFGEAACTLSHLKAIRQAYLEGRELAVIMEDDSTLSAEWVKNWTLHVRQAPPDWTVLQLATSNPTKIRQTANLQDPWVNWLPDFWSTEAYLINRKGMRKLLDKTVVKDSDGNFSTSVRIQERSMAVADEVIYYLSENTYVSSFPFIESTGVESTVHEDRPFPTESLSSVRHNSKPKWAYSLQESIFVYMAFEVKSTEDFHRAVERIRSDSEVLCGYHDTHPHGNDAASTETTSCDWAVHMVVSAPLDLEEELSRVEPPFPPPNVKIYIEKPLTQAYPTSMRGSIGAATVGFNRYQFLLPHLKILGSYDYVLIKDNDYQMTGFPWLTFVQKHKQEKTMISSPLREDVEEFLLREIWKEHPAWFQFQKSFDWQRAKWAKDRYEHVIPFRVDMVENFFVLFDGQFGRWFFQRILEAPLFLENYPKWEVERMLCGAAKDYLVSLNGPMQGRKEDLISLEGHKESSGWWPSWLKNKKKEQRRKKDREKRGREKKRRQLEEEERYPPPCVMIPMISKLALQSSVALARMDDAAGVAQKMEPRRIEKNRGGWTTWMGWNGSFQKKLPKQSDENIFNRWQEASLQWENTIEGVDINEIRRRCRSYKVYCHGLENNFTVDA